MLEIDNLVLSPRPALPARQTLLERVARGDFVSQRAMLRDLKLYKEYRRRCLGGDRTAPRVPEVEALRTSLGPWRFTKLLWSFGLREDLEGFPGPERLSPRNISEGLGYSCRVFVAEEDTEREAQFAAVHDGDRLVHIVRIDDGPAREPWLRGQEGGFEFDLLAQ